MGLEEGAMFPSAYRLFRHWIPAIERSRAVAILLCGVPQGTLFALTTAGELVTRYEWPSVFYISGSAGLLWTVAWFALIPCHPRRGVDCGPVGPTRRGLDDGSQIHASIWTFGFGRFFLVRSIRHHCHSRVVSDGRRDGVAGIDLVGLRAQSHGHRSALRRCPDG